jgi:hypothetical protein
MSRGIWMSRRSFLKGVGGVSLALPLFSSLGCRSSSSRAVEKLGTAALANTGFPKRFIVIYTPNGNIDLELPAGMDFAGSILEPLTPFKDKMLILKGLDFSAQSEPPGEPHQQGMAFLTGRGLNPGNMVGGDGSLAGWASGISLDQEIASVIGGDTKHKSLHFGVQSTAYGGTEVRTVMSYAGSDQPIANETSPYSMFDLVFSELGKDPASASALRARRKSVLDTVGKQYDALAPKLSAEDKLKLEQHLIAVRDVEKRLDNPTGTETEYCQVPALGSTMDLEDPMNFPAIGKLHMDMLVMAMACDLTRVATLQWSAAVNTRPYPFLTYDSGSGAQPILDAEHNLSHMPDSDVHAWGKLRVIRRWYMEQLAYLLGKLAEVKEGEGTMLDNTVVLLASEITRGNTHSHVDTPFLLAGSGGGYFKTGRSLSFSGVVPHNNLLVSIMNAMGIPGTTFGNPAYCTGPIAELVG